MCAAESEVHSFKAFVLASNPIPQIKKSQEKGNDVKRDLLAAGCAARRQVQQSSPSLESTSPAISMNFNLTHDALLTSETPTPGSLDATLALPIPDTTASPCSLPGGLSVLSSQGFATLNQKQGSSKRSRADMAQNHMEGSKRARTKTEKSTHHAQVEIKVGPDGGQTTVEVDTKQPHPLSKLN